MTTPESPRTSAGAGLDPAIPLLTPDGDVIELGSLGGRPLLVQLVRYFGCLPCQQYLRALDARAGGLDAAGVGVVAVGGSASYQARWLRETGVAMPLLLDPEGRFRDAVGMGDLSLRQMAALRGLRAYVGSVVAGVPLRRPTADLRRSPGIALLGAELTVRWAYEGGALGDYPPLDEVVSRARTAGSGLE